MRPRIVARTGMFWTRTRRDSVRVAARTTPRQRRKPARSSAAAAGVGSRSAREKGPAKAGHYRNPEAERRPIFLRLSVDRPPAVRRSSSGYPLIFMRMSMFRWCPALAGRAGGIGSVRL